MSQQGPLNSFSAVLIFLAFFIAIILATSLKKIYYYFKYKKRYYIIPRPSVQGISNISMVIALSVAVLLILTFVTANLFSVLFRAFPGTRVTIEGILIKIGGLLFGPFIGMFVGAITDLLSIIMTAGIFHYGYFISAMAYGLLAGLIRTLFSYSDQKKSWYALTATIISIISCALSISFIFYFFQGKEGALQTIFPFISDLISKSTLAAIIGGFLAFSTALIWFLYLFSKIFGNKNIVPNRYRRRTFGTKQKYKKDYFNNFCLIIICAMTTEILINVLLMPFFDADLSTLGYDNWLFIRILAFIPMVVFNFIIIYPVYVVISPIVSWNYQSELIEDYNTPFLIK
ncbi:MAG: hypothetical protein HUJ42_01895 [Malacoplasma sp.]|nr:hypothetical protein [Malacoplasma sp.]